MSFEKMKSLNKKAQIANLQAIIMTFVVIGLLLGVGFLVLREFSDNLGDTAATVTHEAATVTNSTWKYLAYNHTSVDCWNTFAVTAVRNATGNQSVGSGNYTTDWRGAVKAVGSPYASGTWEVNYTYKWSASSACDAMESTIDAEEEIPAWLSLIVILLVVGIVLALVFKVLPAAGVGAGGFGFGGGSSAGTVAEI